MKKVSIIILAIALIATVALGFVGCEKSLDGTYVDSISPALTIVIEGKTIKVYWTVEGKKTIEDEGTFTRKGSVLTTTLKYEPMKIITVTKEGNLTNPDKQQNGVEVTSTYTKVKSK